MKKKITLIIIILVILIIGVSIFLCIKNQKQSEKDETEIKNINEFENTILHRGGYLGGSYSKVYAFLKNGEYYMFYPQYNGMTEIKAYKGTWEIEEDRIKMLILKEVYLEGGKIVDVEEDDDYIESTKLVDGELKVRQSEITTFLEFEKKKSDAGSRYPEYLEFKDDAVYYSIYEFDTEKEVEEKLEEMYGEIFRMFSEE